MLSVSCGPFHQLSIYKHLLQHYLTLLPWAASPIVALVDEGRSVCQQNHLHYLYHKYIGYGDNEVANLEDICHMSNNRKFLNKDL